MQFGSMLVYCTVYDMYVYVCVCGGGGGGAHQYFFQGAPNPLATALLGYITINVIINDQLAFWRWQISL